MTTLAPAVHPRECSPRISFHSVEPSRVIHRTELVWRPPQPVAKSETHGIRPHFPETAPRSRVLTLESPGLKDLVAKAAPSPAVPAFDAAQMDRFVDNVIQRVEKRARIERDRRGW